MNKARKVLQTCSPLERMVQINYAMGAGVNMIAKKLYSEKGKGNVTKEKGDIPISGRMNEKICQPCKYMEKKTKGITETEKKIPGCMPFTDNQPIKPFYDCATPNKPCPKKKKVKRRASSSGPCGKKKKPKNVCN